MLLTVIAIMMMGLALCACGKKYAITYDSSITVVTPIESAKAGSTVEIRVSKDFNVLTTSVYVDDSRIPEFRYDVLGYYIFEFKMPDHDVTVSAKTFKK